MRRIFDIIQLSGKDIYKFFDAVLSNNIPKLTGENNASFEGLVLDGLGRIKFYFPAVVCGENRQRETETKNKFQNSKLISQDIRQPVIYLLSSPGSAEDVIGWVKQTRFRYNVEPKDITDKYLQIPLIECCDVFLSDSNAHFINKLSDNISENVALFKKLIQISDFVWVDTWANPGDLDYGISQENNYNFKVAFIKIKALEIQGFLNKIPINNNLEAYAEEFLDTSFASFIDSEYKLFEICRILNARPWFCDFEELSIPSESNITRSSATFKKGCYPGRETLAKIHNLGHPARQIVKITLSADMPQGAKKAISAKIRDYNPQNEIFPQKICGDAKMFHVKHFNSQTHKTAPKTISPYESGSRHHLFAKTLNPPKSPDNDLLIYIDGKEAGKITSLAYLQNPALKDANTFIGLGIIKYNADLSQAAYLNNNPDFPLKLEPILDKSKFGIASKSVRNFKLNLKAK